MSFKIRLKRKNFHWGILIFITHWSEGGFLIYCYFVGNWAKALPERFGIVNYVITYFVNRQGDVYIALNGDNLPGPFFCGVNVSSPLWALIDIYGNATGVEFLGELSSLSWKPQTICVCSNQATKHVWLDILSKIIVIQETKLRKFFLVWLRNCKYEQELKLGKFFLLRL